MFFLLHLMFVSKVNDRTFDWNHVKNKKQNPPCSRGHVYLLINPALIIQKYMNNYMSINIL